MCSHCHICEGSFMVLITAECLLFNNADGVWCRESPNEVSPFTEHWGQPKHPAPLPERASAPPSGQHQRHWSRSAREHHASLSWLEQTDVWERHATWTTCATRRLQGDEPGWKLMCGIPHSARLNRCDGLFYFMLILLLFLVCFPVGSYRQPRCHAWDQHSSNICIHDYTGNHSELSDSSIRFLFLLFQIQDGSWHESHFFFHTQDSRQLPIVDIQTFPAPRPSSQRHIEISPVCFFWHWHPRHVACVHTTLMQGCTMAAYQRASIGVWRPERDPAEGCDRVLMSTDNCVKCVLWTAVGQTVLVLAVYGLLQLPDHRVGPSSSQS